MQWVLVFSCSHVVRILGEENAIVTRKILGKTIRYSFKKYAINFMITTIIAQGCGYLVYYTSTSTCEYVKSCPNRRYLLLAREDEGGNHSFSLATCQMLHIQSENRSFDFSFVQQLKYLRFKCLKCSQNFSASKAKARCHVLLARFHTSASMQLHK